MLPETDFWVLNALYLKKSVPFLALAEAVRLPDETVRIVLTGALKNCLVMAHDNEYLLEEAGIQAVLAYHEEMYQFVYVAVLRWYKKFEMLERKVFRIVNEWPTGSRGPVNLAKLLRLVECEISMFRKVLDHMPRYVVYVERLTIASERVESGDLSFISSPRVDSIRTVCSEFREDVLTVIERCNKNLSGDSWRDNAIV